MSDDIDNTRNHTEFHADTNEENARQCVALDLVDVVLQVEEAEICTADDHGEPNLPKL